jgi:hypothetical protein
LLWFFFSWCVYFPAGRPCAGCSGRTPVHTERCLRQVCAAGSYGADCTGTCSPGQYSGHGYPICLPCPAGKYQTSPGSASCPACAIGQYTNAGESPFCNICDMGQINLVAGSTDCKLLTHHATGPPTPPPTPTPPTPHPTIYRKFCDRIQVQAPAMKC